MANEIKLEVYTIRIRQERDLDSYLPLKDFLGGNDFISFLEDYIKSFDNQLSCDDNQKRSFKIASNRIKISSKERIISGIIESGDYGYESEIYNINTGSKTYLKSIEDTEIKPFYFLIYLPLKENKAYLILQRMGIYGIHSIFKVHLSSYFKKKFSKLHIEFNPYISKEVAHTFLEKGNIKEFVLRRFNLPTDVADRLGFAGQEEDIRYIEMRIVSKRKKFLQLNKRVNRFMNDPNAVMFQLDELNALGFDGNHTSQVKVQYEENTRTVDLSDTGQIRPYYDIDKDVTKNRSGHPVFESIDQLAKELIKDLTKVMQYENAE